MSTNLHAGGFQRGANSPLWRAFFAALPRFFPTRERNGVTYLALHPASHCVLPLISRLRRQLPPGGGSLFSPPATRVLEPKPSAAGSVRFRQTKRPGTKMPGRALSVVLIDNETLIVEILNNLDHHGRKLGTGGRALWSECGRSRAHAGDNTVFHCPAERLNGIG